MFSKIYYKTLAKKIRIPKVSLFWWKRKFPFQAEDFLFSFKFKTNVYVFIYYFKYKMMKKKV